MKHYDKHKLLHTCKIDGTHIVFANYVTSCLIQNKHRGGLDTSSPTYYNHAILLSQVHPYLWPEKRCRFTSVKLRTGANNHLMVLIFVYKKN